MTPRRAALIALALVLAGCGSGVDPRTAQTNAELLDEVGDVRAAAEAGNDAAFVTEVSELRAKLTTMRRSGELTEERADEIRRRVADVEASYRASLPPTTTTTTPPPTTVATTAAPTTTSTPPDSKEPPRPGKGKGEDEKDKEDEKDEDKRGPKDHERD